MGALCQGTWATGKKGIKCACISPPRHSACWKVLAVHAFARKAASIPFLLVAAVVGTLLAKEALAGQEVGCPVRALYLGVPELVQGLRSHATRECRAARAKEGLAKTPRNIYRNLNIPTRFPIILAGILRNSG